MDFKGDESQNNSHKDSCFKTRKLSPSTDVKRANKARCQWLTPVILPTQEAENRRIVVRSKPGQIVL
jgi:hypothetical protein